MDFQVTNATLSSLGACFCPQNTTFAYTDLVCTDAEIDGLAMAIIGGTILAVTSWIALMFVYAIPKIKAIWGEPERTPDDANVMG